MSQVDVYWDFKLESFKIAMNNTSTRDRRIEKIVHPTTWFYMVFYMVGRPDRSPSLKQRV